MSETTETIILIHGLWMHGLALLPQQHWLSAEGFAVRRFSYPSWRAGLAENAQRLSDFIRASSGSMIHLVAHSLGGLVALHALALNPEQRVRRAVLLGTPHAGCHCAAALAARPALAPLIGHSMADWLRLPRPSLPAALEIGVIAGTRRIGCGRLFPGLPRPNDGLIGVAETLIDTARDHIALRVSHSGMLLSRVCARQAAQFLKTGSFTHV